MKNQFILNIMVIKILKVIIKELEVLLEIPIKYYPSSYFSNKIRSIYYKYKLGIEDYPTISNNVDFRGIGLIKIGKNFKINKNCTIDSNGSKGIFLGENVSIGTGVYIRSANHSFNNRDVPIQKQGFEYKTIVHESKEYSIIIEDDVWIGSNCILLTGTHLKKGTILSAGSVVSSKIDEYCIAVGNPARVILKR